MYRTNQNQANPEALPRSPGLCFYHVTAQDLDGVQVDIDDHLVGKFAVRVGIDQSPAQTGDGTGFQIRIA